MEHYTLNFHCHYVSVITSNISSVIFKWRVGGGGGWWVVCVFEERETFFFEKVYGCKYLIGLIGKSFTFFTFFPMEKKSCVPNKNTINSICP